MSALFAGFDARALHGSATTKLDLSSRGRRGAKALAEALLPESMVFWRGPEARQQPLRSLGRALFGTGANSRKPGRVALTFDDGPTPLTPQYLRVLEGLGARATFFVVGELCAAQPELVEAIADAGHELAGHGYTHRRFTALSRAELSDELARTRALLPPRSDGRQLVRPPYGSVSLASLLACSQQGFTTVLWSLNSGDWCSQQASEVERTFALQAVAAGEIVLLHEGQSWTMNALPAIVGTLKKAGHELVTVGELLA
jgi:peptidoglycan/xylan/chitin deacetylase (PgdA/CDA1 family)